MNSSRKKQAGGIGSWIFIILVFGGAMTMGAKLIPLYMDHNTMASVLDSMSEEDGLADRRSSELEQMIGQRFKMNNIRDFDIDENIEIKRTGNGVEIVLNYEVRMGLIKNLDMIASFDKSVELRK